MGVLGIVRRFADTLVASTARRLKTGPVGAVAWLYAASSIYRVLALAALIHIVGETGLISRIWLHDHMELLVVVVAIVYYSFVFHPVTLVDEMLQVSRGQRSDLGPLNAMHAVGIPRSDLRIAGHLLVASLGLAAAVSLAVRGWLDLWHGFLFLFLVGTDLVDVLEGSVWRNPRILALVRSSLDRE